MLFFFRSPYFFYHYFSNSGFVNLWTTAIYTLQRTVRSFLITEEDNRRGHELVRAVLWNSKYELKYDNGKMFQVNTREVYKLHIYVISIKTF